MTLFRNINLLDEGNSAELTERQKEEELRLASRIKSLMKKKSGSILAFIGNFGSGKTTVIDHLKGSEQFKDAKWISFDVWRYSNRDQIWDGFVIEIISELRKDSRNIQTLKKTAEKVEGESSFANRIKGSPILTLVILFIVWLVGGYILWCFFRDPHDEFGHYIKAMLISGIGTLSTLGALFGITTLFSQHRPMKRFFDFEEELLGAINSQKTPTVVIIEDVDRVGEEGMVFMETLCQFLKSQALKTAIVVIAPQSKLYLNVASDNTLQGFERGIKIYDSVMYFAGSSLNADDALSLIEEAGISGEYEDQKDNLSNTIRYMLNAYANRLSMRTYKFILRELDEYMAAYPNALAPIAFILIMARHTHVEFAGRRMSAIEVLSEGDSFGPGHPDLRRFLIGLISTDQDATGYNRVIDLAFANTAAEIDFQLMGNGDVRKITLDSKYKILMA